jgi:hypothetical protein
VSFFNHPVIFLLMIFLGNEQEEAACRQRLLEANRAERAKRSARKLNKANGVDMPAQSDDEERENTIVCVDYF